MNLQLITRSTRPEAAGHQLSKALRIESYFRGLLCRTHNHEVLSQWEASRRLVTRALQDYIDWCEHGQPVRLHHVG